MSFNSSGPDGAVSYRSTVWACYTANFVGALVINLTPILFIPLKTALHLSYTQLGILLAANYITQTAADLLFSAPADRYGVRPFIVAAPALTLMGYFLFALAPNLAPQNPFPLLLAGTILFSATGGLLELLLNVIINGIPGDQKVTLMSLLHSFYAWGQLTVVLLTTLAVYFAGGENWQWIICAWAILPLVNLIQFSTCPLPPALPEEKRLKNMDLLKQKTFHWIILTIFFAGMTEVTIVLWTSAYLERAMLLPKLLGDVSGVCLFALTLGIGRALYGLKGEKSDTGKLMMYGCGFSVILYMAAALSPSPAVSLIACGLCGFSVSLLWPGSVILAGKAFPLAGALLYAMLAAGGDSGAALGPALLGYLADTASDLPLFRPLPDWFGITQEQFNLRFGLLCGSVFPLCTLLCLKILRRSSKTL